MILVQPPAFLRSLVRRWDLAASARRRRKWRPNLLIGGFEYWGREIVRLDQVISLLEEVTRTDLEACEAAIRAADQTAAIDAIELAFAKLDTALDMLRAQPSG